MRYLATTTLALLIISGASLPSGTASHNVWPHASAEEPAWKMRQQRNRAAQQQRIQQRRITSQGWIDQRKQQIQERRALDVRRMQLSPEQQAQREQALEAQRKAQERRNRRFNNRF